MKFLVICKTKYPLFPETTMGLLDAMSRWTKRLLEQGKLVQAWSLAGAESSAGVLDVESHQELDALVTTHPLGAVSTIDVYPLIDLIPALDAARDALQRSMKV